MAVSERWLVMSHSHWGWPSACYDNEDDAREHVDRIERLAPGLRKAWRWAGSPPATCPVDEDPQQFDPRWWAVFLSQAAMLDPTEPAALLRSREAPTYEVIRVPVVTMPPDPLPDMGLEGLPWTAERDRADAMMRSLRQAGLEQGDELFRCIRRALGYPEEGDFSS